MKILLIAAILLCAFTAPAQTTCPEGRVCIAQSTADACASNKLELDAAKMVIEAFKLERIASDKALAKSAEAYALLEKVSALKDEIIAIKDRKEIAYKELDAIREKTQAVLMSILDDLEKRLTKKKSGLSAFLGQVKKVLETIIYVAGGIAIGRGL